MSFLSADRQAWISRNLTCQVGKGRYPKDLNELVQDKYLARAPQPPYGTKPVYDSRTSQLMMAKP